MIRVTFCALALIVYGAILVSGNQFVDQCRTLDKYEKAELLKLIHRIYGQDPSSLNGQQLRRLAHEMSPGVIGSAAYAEISSFQPLSNKLSDTFNTLYLNPCSNVESELYDYIEDAYKQLSHDDKEGQECIALFSLCEMIVNDKPFVKSAMLDQVVD